MRTKIAKMGSFGKVSLAAMLALAGSAGGCGQTSFFEVTVAISNASGVDIPCLITTINSCEVTVSGAASDSFTLQTAACAQVPQTRSSLGTFQYGTGEDSGNVTFHVDVFDSNLTKPPLAQGDATAAIKSGMRQSVTLNATPNAGFRCP